MRDGTVEPYDEQFDAMGCTVRVMIDPSSGDAGRDPREAGRQAREFILDFDRRLSRFRADSELTALNRDLREEVPASDLLRAAVRAGLRAARSTNGLVDPTLVDQIEQAGYRESRAGLAGVPIPELLSSAPTRESASPSPGRSWRMFEVDDERGIIRRSPGLRFDTGGTGKGLAADMVAGSLADFPRFLVNCGGDIRIGGNEASGSPYDVLVEHPASGNMPHRFKLGRGGIATSGINVRAWLREGGSPGHHLLDPSTGEPCWSGLLGVTAIGPTAVEAETLAKAALLSGPTGARKILSHHGGLMVHEDSQVEMVGRATIRLRLPEVRLRTSEVAV